MPDRGLPRDVLLTVVFVAGAVIAADLAFAAIVPRLSINSRTLAQHGERAERIAASERPTVLILGNSMSRDSIDAPRLRELLAEHGADVLVEHQPADASIPRDWYYEFANQFVERGAVPDALVLPVGDGRPFVRTKPPIEDLMQTFLRFDDLPTYFEVSETTDFDERLDVVCGCASALYCFRGRLQKRVLTELDPGYEHLRTAMQSARPRRTGPPASNPRWIEMIADLAREHDVRVIVVPLPTRDLNGRLRDTDREMAESFGWTILEPAADVPFSDEELPDGMHLVPEAKLRFTELLAEPLAEALVEDE